MGCVALYTPCCIWRADGLGGTSKFFEPRQRPQPIVYCLSRNVLGLRLRWPGTMIYGVLVENEGSRE
jgi:hypothetical protein